MIDWKRQGRHGYWVGYKGHIEYFSVIHTRQGFELRTDYPFDSLVGKFSGLDEAKAAAELMV